MKDRIRLVMERAQLSQQDFARKLEISPASLSSIFTGRTNPTNNHVSAVHRAFPDINVNWLMFGEGDMYLPTAAAGSGENAAEGAGAGRGYRCGTGHYGSSCGGRPCRCGA